MLRLNKDRTYTLLKVIDVKKEDSNCSQYTSSLIPSKILTRSDCPLIDFHYWAYLYASQLDVIMFHLGNFIENLDFKDLNFRINVMAWESSMRKKIYEKSESKYKYFMRL